MQPAVTLGLSKEQNIAQINAAPNQAKDHTNEISFV